MMMMYSSEECSANGGDLGSIQSVSQSLKIIHISLSYVYSFKQTCFL